MKLNVRNVGGIFKVDESGYIAIAGQVRDAEFNKELNERKMMLKTEQASQLKLAEANAKVEQEKIISETKIEIEQLKSQLQLATSDKLMALKDEESSKKEELSKKDIFIAKLEAEIASSKTGTDLEIKNIKEVNAGVYCCNSKELFNALDNITNNNEKGEYYLTDIVGIQVAKGQKVKSFMLEDSEEILGINSKIELAKASKILRERKNIQLMEEGVIFIDSDTAYIHETVKIGKDTIIYPGVVLQGNTIIGENCEIIGNTRIIDSKLGNNIRVESSVIEESILDDLVTIGPFAHLRPKTHLKEKVHIGNFVEVKKSTLEYGVKAGHLTYLGNATIGKNTNIGAGTITCNYDGVNKFDTNIGEKVFIGSNTMLVAPIVIGNNATTGAGSVITKDVPEDALGVERTKQLIKLKWRK